MIIIFFFQIIFNAFLAVTLAAPGYFEYNNHGKSIFSSISKLINHERSHDLYSPVLATHDAEYNAQLDKTHSEAHTAVVSAPVIHAPVVSAPVIYAPVVSVPVVHAPIYRSPIVSYKTPSSAILVKTVPVSNSLPLYASHHH